MKLIKFGAGLALLAAAGSLVGCSSEPNQQAKGGSQTSSVGFHLLASNGVTLTSANYDLNTQAGADVVDGSIPVPNDDSTITLGIQNLGAGDYVLAFSATGSYQGHSVPCTSAPTTFHLNAAQQLTLPTITLTCSVTNQVDTTGGVNADVSVAVDTITVGSVIETFTYGPRSVIGHKDSAGACVYPPVALKVANSDTTIAYSWSTTDDGTFSGPATNGTYACATGGTKHLTLTGVKAGTTSTKTVTVSCDDSVCAAGVVCGDGVVTPPFETCDSTASDCVNCHIVQTCGDGIVDAPEQCDDLHLPTATCDINCHTVVPAFCGDGTVNPPTETCDNGSANSDTAPNACRTNCQPASCGDGVVDSGEGCDAGMANSNTTSNACRTNCQPAHCGDGVLDSGEECDATALPTATCDATCHNIIVVQPRHVACESCLAASAEGDFKSGFCDGQSACTTALDCMTDAQCFNPDALFCYCGHNSAGVVDVTACRASTFVPTGACATQLAAGIVGAGSTPTNAEVQDGLFDYTQKTGVAGLLLTSTQPGGDATECATKCL